MRFGRILFFEMIDVLEIINKIQSKNREEKKSPDYACFQDIQTEVTAMVKKEINQLILDGKLRHHETINSFSFEVLENKND